MKNKHSSLNELLEKLNTYILSFVNYILSNRIKVILVCAVVLAVSAFFASKVYIDNSSDAYFMQDDKNYSIYHNFMEEYGNDEFIYIVYNAKDGVFAKDNLIQTKLLVEDLKKISFMKKVTAITNLEFIEGENKGQIKISNLLKDIPATKKEIDIIKNKLLSKKYFVNTFISKDAEYAAVLCELSDKPKDDPNFHQKIGSELNKILSKDIYKDFHFWPVGEPVYNAEFYSILKRDSSILSLLSFVIITLVLGYFFRQIKLIIAPLVVVGCSIILIVGFMGLFNMPVTAMFDMVPSLIIAIGIANSMHLLTEYRHFLIAGYNNRDAIIESIKITAIPTLFTSLTTAVGFASTGASPIAAITEFSYYTSVGVIGILLFLYTLLLIILSFKGNSSEAFLKGKEYKETEKQHKYFSFGMRLIEIINQKYNIQVLAIGFVICVISIYGMFKLEVNSSLLEEMGEKVKVFQDYKFVDKTMAGTSNMEIILNSNKPEGIRTIEFFNILEKIQDFAKKQGYIVGKTSSIVDIIKDINCTLHNNNKEYYKIPLTDNELSQYILLYEVSGGKKLDRFVSGDMATSRLTIYMRDTDTKIGGQFYDDISKYVDSVIPKNYDYKITGVSVLWIKAMDYIGTSQVFSFSVALIIISIMMFFVFRSVKIGIISMIPNIMPIFLTLGIMGLAGINLDYVRILIATIAIGIIVDDTIHYISRFRLEFNKYGNYKKALTFTLTSVGNTISITSIILILGFSVCIASKLNDVYYFGILSSLCIFTGILIEHFVTPSLILALKPFGKEVNPDE